MVAYTFDFQSLDLSPADILREMGYGKVKPEKELIDALCTIFDEVAKWVQPACVFQILDGETEMTTIQLGNGEIMSVGAVIAKLLKGATRFALFAATTGEAFQEYQQKIKKDGDMLAVFILDTIGSCIVERAGDKMELLLEKEITGYLHTHRFSPGYCGWSLTEQKMLFRMLGGNPCGILLSDVCLMSPIKSISGIIGIGTDVQVRKYGCEICQLDTCYKRKNKIKKI